MEFNGKLIRYLLSSSLYLSTEGRFLLLCLLHEYSTENKEIDIRVERLVDTYGITRTVCSQVSKFLSSSVNEIAQIRREKTNVCEFNCTSLSKLSSDFNDGKQGDYHRDIVVYLLSIKSKNNEKESGVKLRISNLLLLIILLVHADKGGSVRGVSKAKLRKLMGGISGDRLNSQLKTLADKNYILVISRGGSGRKLFGKVSNSYLLNLGRLQGRKCQADREVRFNEQSILGGLENTVRTMQKIRQLNYKNYKKELRSLWILLGDDLDADMSIAYLLLNKCEIIASILLTECWNVIDTLKVNQCNILDLPICKSLLTRGELFATSYCDKYMNRDISKLSGNDYVNLNSKARKEKYRNEIIVTDKSFQQWTNSVGNIEPPIHEAHQLTEFLLKQSLAIAKSIKALLVILAKQNLQKPSYIGMGFEQIKLHGSHDDSYVLSISLYGIKRHDVYSILAKRIDKYGYTYTVNVTEYYEG